MNPILLHRSYVDISGRPGTMETVFRTAWELGYNGVEVNAPGCGQELADVAPGIDTLARFKEKWITPVIVLHFPMGLIEDDKWPQREAVYERMQKSFELASAKLGVTLFNTMASGPIIPEGNQYVDYAKNGSIAATETHWERAVEMLTTASRLAAESHITLAIEVHGCLIHDLPETTLDLLDRVGAANLGANPDVGNMTLVRENFLAPEELEPLVPRTTHVHLKNVRMVLAGGGGWLIEGTGNGQIDYLPLARSLTASGYRGPYSLEFPGLYGDPRAAAARDLAFTQRLLLEAAGEE